MLAWTWRRRRHGLQEVAPALESGRVVMALWHGEQLAFLASHRHLPISLMTSTSRDGELLARVLHRLGYRAIRGSSSRRGKEAFQDALAVLDEGRIPAVTLDGPRGPRLVPKVGASALAAARRVGVCWCVTHSWPCLRLGSWDRFEIPLPFARVDLHYGWMEPAPDPTDRARVEQERQRLGEVMRATWAQVRGEPTPPPPPASEPVSPSGPTPP